jgi:hypothetical protein
MQKELLGDDGENEDTQKDSATTKQPKKSKPKSQKAKKDD